MSWSRKKVAAIAAKVDRKPPEDWSAGDRIGKTSGNVLRDLRMRAEMRGEVDPARFAALVEILEDVLGVAREEQSDSMVCAEELADFARKLVAERDAAVKEQQDADAACDEQIEELKQGHAQAMADLAETADEYRRRAEKAEHDLAEAVRQGHALDRETADRIRRLEIERNALLDAAKEAIPEAEYPADQSIVHDWAWQIKMLGEDRRAAYKQKAEAEDAREKAERELAEMRSNLEIALERRKAAEIARGDLEKIQALRATKAERDELQHALANERTTTKLLEEALERQRKLTPMKARRTKDGDRKSK